MVEQMARLALRYSDRAYVLEHGKIVHAGPADELARNREVLEAYLGRRDDGDGAPEAPRKNN